MNTRIDRGRTSMEKIDRWRDRVARRMRAHDARGPLRTLSGTSPYLSGPPITVDENGQERLFSIPLVVSPSVPDDTAVIADMQSVGVWLRSMQVYLSESHASYFPLNLVAILAELRAALGVLAPAGVGTVTGWD